MIWSGGYLVNISLYRLANTQGNLMYALDTEVS